MTGKISLHETNRGCLLWWHTAEVFKKWDIVVYDENFWEFEEYDMQLCDFYINTSLVKLTVKDFRTAFEKRRNRN